MDTLRNGATSLVNTNRLVRFYQGATGLKTGTTGSAGYCISATAERDGMELIAVVLGDETSQQRFEDAKTLLNYGFSAYALAHVAPPEPPTVPVKLGAAKAAALAPAENVLLVKKEQAGSLTYDTDLPECLTAPVEKGQQVGTLTVRCGDEILREIPLTAAESVERMSWSGLFLRLLQRAVFG